VTCVRAGRRRWAFRTTLQGEALASIELASGVGTDGPPFGDFVGCDAKQSGIRKGGFRRHGTTQLDADGSRTITTVCGNKQSCCETRVVQALHLGSCQTSAVYLPA